MTPIADDDNLPVVRIVHNMARAGGTLISRCIGALEGVRLLSEIHPLGHRNRHFNAVSQYQQWYEDLGIEDFRELGFDRSIDRIHNHVEQTGDKLVLRDWAHIDFIGPPASRPPGFRLTLDARLEDRYRLLHCAVVRHPMDTWRSMRKMSVVIDNGISVERFLAGYRRYLDRVAGYEQIRYEDFTEDPETVMMRICRALNLPMDSGFLDRWANNRRITGDIHNNSRAGASTTIRQLPIRPLAGELQTIAESNADYQDIIRRLGYPF